MFQNEDFDPEQVPELIDIGSVFSRSRRVGGQADCR